MEEDGEVFKVITANRLRDGIIVYLRIIDDRELAWVEAIGDATAFAEHEVESALARATAAEQQTVVVGVYPTEVAGRNRPLTARERIRANGPSVKYGHAALAPDFTI